MKLIQYRGEIDGLRALSVLAVVLFHFDFLSVTGGFYGVDVFFVISGYLISSLLFAEVDRTGTLSISNFYLRRTRRILPALLVVCLATYLLFAFFVGEIQSPFPHFGQSLLATLFSVSNIFFWQKAGYFSLDAWAEPLLHTWSLGVEEQFYLIIPLLLYWLSRAPGEVGRRKRYLAVFFCMAVLSFALCRYGADLVGRDFIFYMLPTRMWELLLGVLVSLILRRRMLTRLPHRWLNELLSVVGVAVMLYGFFTFYETTRIAEKSLVVTSGAALFLLFTNEATLVGRLFTSRAMRLTGNISYSWYLWHWPLVSLSVMMEVKYPGLSSIAVRIGLCVLSYVLAFFSWKYVETPFRRIKSWLPCIKRLAPLFILLVGIGLVNVLHVFGNTPYTFEHRFVQGSSLKEPTDAARLGVKDKPISFLLIGNSHAQSVAPAVDDLARKFDMAGILNWDGMMPFLGITWDRRFDDVSGMRELLEAYLAESGIRNIICVARMDQIWELAPTGKVRYHGKRLSTDAEVAAAFEKELPSFLALLAADGRNVWVMEQVPRADVNPIVAVRVIRDYTEAAKPEPHNRILDKVVANLGLPNLHVFNARDFFVKDGRVHFTAGNKLLYFDDDHLSVEGAFHIQSAFLPIFEAMARER